MYCDYCGYSYIKKRCVMCSGKITICGCDAARESCEEHYCAACQEPHIDLDEYGLCNECQQKEE